MVGASTNPGRHSHRVMRFMQECGYRVVPVNPTATGQTILGEEAYASLADIPAPIDMVNVFRRQEAIPEVVADVVSLAAAKMIRYLWLQLELYDEFAARRARGVGLKVVMDRCLKIEFGRLQAHLT